MSNDDLTHGNIFFMPKPSLHARHVLTLPPGEECIVLEDDQLVPIPLVPAPDAT